MSTVAALGMEEPRGLARASSRSVPYTAYGVAFHLSSNNDGILAAMVMAVPFGAEAGEPHHDDALIVSLDELSRDESFSLCIGANAPISGGELKPMLEQLRTELMVHIANQAKDRVVVHAGVVGWQGHALIFPGPSFAGKSTLIAALVRAGATYYSDEYAVLDEQGSVYPYARDLQMREPGGVEQTSLSSVALSDKVGNGPLRVAHVIFATYVPDGRWQTQPVSAGTAVLEMLRHTIPVQRTPARVMSTLTAMMQTATALRSERGEARETAEAILNGIALQIGAA